MISPTVGRIVLVRFRDMDSLPAAFKAIDLDQPFAGVVAYVFSDRCVNLTVADHDGATRPLTSVRLLQDDDKPNGEGYYAEWMPFQKGQAANLAGAADGIAAKVEQHVAEAKASIAAHAAEIVAEIKRYFATPAADAPKPADPAPAPGANVHGLGPDTAGGPNPDYVPPSQEGATETPQAQAPEPAPHG